MAAWFARLRHGRSSITAIPRWRISAILQGFNLLPAVLSWLSTATAGRPRELRPPLIQAGAESYGVKPIYALFQRCRPDFLPQPGAPCTFQKQIQFSPAEKRFISVGHYIEAWGRVDFVEPARSAWGALSGFGYTNLNLVPAHPHRHQNLLRKSQLSRLCGTGGAAGRLLAAVCCLLSNEETERIVVLKRSPAASPPWYGIFRSITAGWPMGRAIWWLSRRVAEKHAAILTGALPDLTASGPAGCQGSAVLDAVGESLPESVKKKTFLSAVYLRENSSLAAADTMNTSTCGGSALLAKLKRKL